MPKDEKRVSIVRTTYTIVIPEMRDIDTIVVRHMLEDAIKMYPEARITANISHPLRRMPTE